MCFSDPNQGLASAQYIAEQQLGEKIFIIWKSDDNYSTGIKDKFMAEADKLGLNVVKVVTQEDVSNAPRENADDRRGLVGCIPTYKIAGAAAAEGKSLEEVAAIAQRFADNMATLAVAVRGATHPSTGAALADLGEDDMEIGMGQHGEGGGGQKPLVSADDTAAEMVDLLCQQLQPKAGDKMLLIINGVGATTHMELNIIFLSLIHI